MIWVFGLGNPGGKYRLTRHNAGYMVLDALAEKHCVRLRRLWFRRVLWGSAEDGRLVLIKPETFMNRSGLAAAGMVRWKQLPVERLVVVVDDTALPPGTIRVRSSGGAGGHNGLKSLIEMLGTERFIRVRVGIGRPAEGGDWVNYVLSDFTDSEWPVIKEAVEKAAEAVEFIEEHGVEKAMNRFN